MKTCPCCLPCGADCANTFSRPTRKSGPSKAGRTFCRAFGWRYNALYLAVGKVCGRGHPGTPFGGLAAPDPQMYTHTRAPLRRSFCRFASISATLGGKTHRALRGTKDARRRDKYITTLPFRVDVKDISSFCCLDKHCIYNRPCMTKPICILHTDGLIWYNEFRIRGDMRCNWVSPFR